jgi:hypothetical protein
MMQHPSKNLAAMCLLHFLTMRIPFSAAYWNGCKPKVNCRSHVSMNTDQVPQMQTRISMPFIPKYGLLGFGSLLTVALIRKEKAVAIDLPECSDSVTIFRRPADNREVHICRISRSTTLTIRFQCRCNSPFTSLNLRRLPPQFLNHR